MKHLGVYVEDRHDNKARYFLKTEYSRYTSGTATLHYFESKGWDSISRLRLEGKLIIPMEFVK